MYRLVLTPVNREPGTACQSKFVGKLPRLEDFHVQLFSIFAGMVVAKTTATGAEFSSSYSRSADAARACGSKICFFRTAVGPRAAAGGARLKKKREGQMIESNPFAKNKRVKEPAPSAAEGMGHPVVSWGVRKGGPPAPCLCREG